MRQLNYILKLTIFHFCVITGAAQNFSFEHLTTEQGLSQSTVNSIIQDQKGFIWIGTGDGLDKFDGYSIYRYSHDNTNPKSISKNTILSLYEDSDGFIWIGTYGGGLNKFDFSTQTFTHFETNSNQKNSLSNNQIFEIFEDSEGIFWIGTEKTLLIADSYNLNVS